MASRAANTTQLQALLEKDEPDSYDELIARSSDRLLQLTRRMLRRYPRLRRWEATDDVFQTAAMRLHRSLSEVRPTTVRQFFGLASTQIRRTLIDLLRHHFGPQGQAGNHDSVRTDNVLHVRNQPDASSQPETLALWTSFHEAVGELPTDERDVFELFWYSGLQQKDIGLMLGISVATVQRRLYRARHILQQTIADASPSKR